MGSFQKNWCWTLHDPTELEIGKLISDHDGVGYIVWQEETCPDTGRIHLQGYVQFDKKAVLSRAKKILTGDKNHRIHLEPAKGTPMQNKTYCTKDGGRNVNEWGLMSVAGKSRELTEIADAISKGEMTIDQVMNEAPATYVMYGKGLEALAVNTMADRDRDVAPEVLWYHGGTGTGKSRKAWDDDPDLYVWSGQWPFFNGYRGQETVLFDDFRGTIPFSMFLRLLDRYPMSVDTKGGYMKWRAKKIVVTSALHWEDVYDKEKLHAEDKIAQLKRRISKTVEFRQLNL